MSKIDWVQVRYEVRSRLAEYDRMVEQERTLGTPAERAARRVAARIAARAIAARMDRA